MKAKFISALIVGLVATTSAASAHATEAARPATKAEVAAMTQQLKERLKDPGSVQLRNVKAIKTPDAGTQICGEVNAKNSFGGYVGFAAFIGSVFYLDTKKFVMPMIVGIDDADGTVVRDMCREKGITL